VAPAGLSVMYPHARHVVVVFSLFAFLFFAYLFTGGPESLGSENGGKLVHHSAREAPEVVEEPETNSEERAPPEEHAVQRGTDGKPLAPAAPLDKKFGSWNGIPMMVNTSKWENVYIRNMTVKLESLDVRRNKGGRTIRKLRLLWPQIEKTMPSNVRKVWIDAGARFFIKGSTQWFVRHYPLAAQYEVALFDVLDMNDAYPPVVRQQFKKFEFFSKAVWIHNRGVEVKGKKMAHVKEKGAAEDAAVQDGIADTRTTWVIESIDFAAFLQSRYTKADFVVLKMDIEGGEWEVIAHLIQTGAIDLIDELMLECHARGAGASLSAKYLHQSCVDLINLLRRRGVAAHRWV
jgi:hypothetical protein